MASPPALVLGTAQWGLDYGITNAEGRLTDETVRAVLAVLPRLGIRLLDTAPAYGDAEARIGVLAPDPDVQTKVSGTDDVRASLARSAALLGRAPVRAIVHDWPSLTAAQQRRAARDLESVRRDGLVALVGVSGYDRADLAAALAAFERLDVAQLPVSVLDQRLAGSEEVADLRARGGLLQARSVYLQGLALGDAGRGGLSDHPDLRRLRQRCEESGVDLGACCRAYARSRDWIDEIVIGVTSAEELLAWASDDPIGDLSWTDLASDDPALLDPRRWPPPGRGG